MGAAQGARPPWRYLTRERHSVPLRAGRRLHDLRRLPLLAAGPDRSRTATTCGPAGSATTASGGGPVIDNADAGYGWSTYPERLQAAGVSWKIYQDVGTGLDAGGTSGAGPTNALYRQLRRQLAAVLPPVPERAPGSARCYEKARHRHQHRRSGGTLFDIFRKRRRRQHAAAGLVDRGAGSLQRASELAGRTTAPGTSRRCSMR